MKNFDFVGRRRTLILIWVLSFLSFFGYFLVDDDVLDVL
jgi:hypothetical protein